MKNNKIESKTNFRWDFINSELKPGEEMYICPIGFLKTDNKYNSYIQTLQEKANKINCKVIVKDISIYIARIV